jgi:hypothetical protein
MRDELVNDFFENDLIPAGRQVASCSIRMPRVKDFFLDRTGGNGWKRTDFEMSQVLWSKPFIIQAIFSDQLATFRS